MDKNFLNKIEIVAGESFYGGWYAGNLSYHLKDRPKLRYELNDISSKKASGLLILIALKIAKTYF